MHNKEESEGDSNKPLITINPLGPFLKKYEVDINVPKDVPPHLKAIMAIAAIAGAAHALMAWVKATWISYTSLDILFIVIVSLILWDEKRHHDFENEKENSS